MYRYFFKPRDRTVLQKDIIQECCIQIPSSQDIEQMHSMPAGADEDQFKRLKNMSEVLTSIQTIHSSLPVITTKHVVLSKSWNQLFASMKHGNVQDTLAIFAKFPQDDKILHVLLSVHTLEYLQRIIVHCIQSQKTGCKRLNSDILITPGTLEILVKDIATTLFHAGKVHLSFGLPTHHAYTDKGSGFCILNKSAVLIKYLQSLSIKPLKYIIVGTDVNRDNGLCDILMNSAADLDICHIDVFDSRVYPQQDNEFISYTFKQPGQDVGQEIQLWQQENFKYYAVDLSRTQRQSSLVHPAISFSINKIKEQIAQAKAKQQKIALFLPTGWDSHEDETAPCGKYVHGKFMEISEARQTRFNDDDLSYFYENIFRLYQENKDDIEKVYWGLEGGYDRKMYKQQIKLLMSLVLKEIVLHEKPAENAVNQLK